MSAKQNSKGRWGRAVAHVGIVGAYLALGAACSGSIEETDVDRTREERGASTPAPSTTPAPAAPAAPRPSAPAPSGTPPTGNATPPAATPPAATPPAATPPAATPPATAELSFEADVLPIFSTRCGPCHAAAATAGVNIADSDVASALDNAVEKEARIFARIEAGTMPPSGCSGPPGSGGTCMTEAEFETLEAWYEAGTPE